MAYPAPVALTRLDFSGGFNYYGPGSTVTPTATVNLPVPEIQHLETGVTLQDGQVLTEPLNDFVVPNPNRLGWATPNGSRVRGWSYDLSVVVTAPGQPTVLWSATVRPTNNIDNITPGMGTITTGTPSESGGSTSADLPALTRLHTALSNITAAPFDALHVGDSITEGANATGIGKRWVDIIRDRARTKYQPIGVTGGPNYVKGGHTYPGTVPFNWVRGGGATLELASGTYLGGYTMVLDAAGETTSLTFTGTSITVFYNAFTTTGAPSLPVTIDGAAAASIGPFNTAGIDESATKVYGGLTPGSHTIVISHPGGSTVKFRVHGALVNNGDESSGWRTWESALAGSQTFVSAIPAFTRQIRKVNPDLVTIYYGTNEYINNLAPATFETRLGDVVSAVLNNIRPRPTVALIRGYKPAHNGSAEVYAWPLYRDAVARVAEAKGVMLIDLEAPFANGTGLIDTDGVHPTDAGHAVIADTVQKAFLL